MFGESKVKLGVQLENKVLAWVKEHKKIFFLNIIFGSAAYFMMMSGNLVNSYDGVWNTSYLIADAWETSLGRGLLHYLDKARAGVVSMPLNAMLVLLIVSVVSGILQDLYFEGSRRLGALASLVLVVNPVICATLSYCFTSVGYAMAFLFSVLAVCCICRGQRIAGTLLGAGFIAMSLGCYQAYFGVTCLLCLLQAMKMLLGDADAKKMAEFAVKSVSAILAGGLIYSFMSNILLRKYGIALSSYGGASQVSVGRIITSLPVTIMRCHRIFYDFFVVNKMNVIAGKLVVVLVALVVIVCVIRQFLAKWRKNKGYAVCFLACVCLVPVACNAVILLTTGTDVSTLMSMGMIMAQVILPAVLLAMERSFFLKRAGYMVIILLLWVNILTVANDQLALKEGKTAATELAEAALGELISGGYLEKDAIVAFVGRPCENNLFVKTAAWNRANAYAKFGNWWVDAGSNNRSWSGVLRECCGITLKFCSQNQYDELRRQGVFSDMPDFPAEGSIREINGIIVIKISGAY